jgi:hypothetical protein
VDSGDTASNALLWRWSNQVHNRPLDTRFETKDLRENLDEFFNTLVEDPVTHEQVRLGNYRWGVYAFYDYDGEPIYVGETNERLRTRIRRHLTNQRTDAAAMSVLDAFEVYRIVVWPLPEFENVKGDKHPDRPRAIAHLKSLEEAIYKQAIGASAFRAVLNEKIPKPKNRVTVEVPQSFGQIVVSESVHSIRSHPDTRLARRAFTIAKLAQVISERKVNIGLRNVLTIQARRLQALADRRFEALGGKRELEAEAQAEPADKTEAELEREEDNADPDD